jgi:hypothetical protein
MTTEELLREKAELVPERVLMRRHKGKRRRGKWVRGCFPDNGPFMPGPAPPEGVECPPGERWHEFKVPRDR